MQHRISKIFLVLLLVWGLPFFCFADEEDKELETIEAEIKKQAPLVEEKKEERKVPAVKKPPVEELKVEKLSDLSKLSPFTDVSVLQRRYMPKSGRFQFNGGISGLVNDPWNTAFGLNLRAAYGFSEMWGIEFQTFTMSGSASQSSQELNTQHGVNAKSNFGLIASFTGAHLMWTPVYGKISLFNVRIIPFDMYFILGGGYTYLDGGRSESSAPTVSIGTGQIFALSRSMAFRWDLTWNMFSLANGSTNNLLLSFGGSFYFPGAKYR